jgi:TIR domain
MQTIFLSYNWEDEEIAATLKELLAGYNYKAQVDSDKSYQGGDWRIEMMYALKNSDVIIPIYTQNTFKSQFVPGEVGMARAYKDMGNSILIIPVLVSIEMPPFLMDLNSIFIKSASIEDLTVAAKKINDSIQKQLSLKRRYPRIFISHRHKDEKIVRALVDFLGSAFDLKQEDIRCTSVHPYKLPPGAKTSERLKDELNNAEVVLGVISPDVDESQYVLFELGASWGLDVDTFPLLTAGAAAKDVPGPLGERHCISLAKQEDCWQLIDELKKVTSLEYRNNNNVKISSDMQALVAISGTIQ